VQFASRIFCSAGLVVVLFGSTAALYRASADETADPKTLEEGKSISFDRTKGNCLACHIMDDGDLPGNQGPPLVGMKQRFPDKAELRAQIWDAQVRNPHTMMPPFGKHGILTEEELDKVVEYVYSL
jgi:sulfur-oxidizing protein SoxX